MHRILGIFWGLCILCTIYSVSSESACSTLPLSVSSLNICEDNNCRTTETAQLRLGLNKGTSECVRVESTGSQVLPSLFNITIIDSVLSYPLVNCYFSDDPTFDLEGFCGCPGGSSVSCDNCPNVNPTGDVSICTSGLHNSKGCFLGGAGTWCAKIGFSGVNRFKLCELGDPELQLSFTYFDTKENKAHTVTNPNIVTLSNNVFNLTLLNPIIGDKQRPEYMVWDLNQNQNFYLVPSKFVNDDDEYDPSKIGWFKTNRSASVTTKFFESSNIQITSCSQNTFTMGTSAQFFSDYLTNHPEFCAQRVAPGAILRDPGFGSISASTGETVENLVDLIEGKFFVSIAGDVFPVGIDFSNKAYPEVNWWAVGWTIDTNLGPITADFICSNSTAILQVGDIITSIFTCQNSQNAANWGPCIVETSNDPLNPPTYTCTNLNFVAIDWPNNGLQTFTFNETFVRLSNNAPDIIEKSDAVLIPIKTGFIDLLLEFKNVTFTFDTINAIPHIDSIDDTDDDIVVVASSKTVPGNCVLMISDDLGPTVSVYLALVNNKYRIPITRKRFEGTAVITLQCFKNKDAVSFKIDVNKQDPEVVEKSINSTSVREASMPDVSVWTKFIRSASKTGDFFGNIFSTIFSLTGSRVWDFFLGLLIVLSFIVAIPLTLYLIWRILCYIYRKIRYMRSKNNEIIVDREGFTVLSNKKRN